MTTHTELISKTATSADGQVATFRQKREGLDEIVEGQARRIEYDTVSQTVRFSQQAQVRLLRSGELADQISGASLFFKCENFQRVGAFKFRGGFNALSRFTPEQKKRGALAFSSGNHAQAIALSEQHRLTRVESQNFPLIGATMFRWRIPDNRSVETVSRVRLTHGAAAIDAAATTTAATPQISQRRQ